MYRFFAYHALKRATLSAPHVTYAVSRVSSLVSVRPYSQFRFWHMNDAATIAACTDGSVVAKHTHQKYSPRPEKLKALGAEDDFPRYDPTDVSQIRFMEEWYARGPPPLCERAGTNVDSELHSHYKL